MRERHAAEIFLDLTSSGLEPESAEILSGGAGLSGTRARNFISGHGLPEISSTVEENLFSLVWGQMEDDVERLVSKPDVVERYGATDWETLNPVIRDIVVDLRFRGDFTPRTRTFLQSSIVANDLSAFAMFLSDRSLWQNVPRQRFEQRMKYLSSALAEAE